ncbi:MAG: alpha-L-rhamnosidase N-terminal domain-containing protein, partial [bacterium]
MSTVKQDTPFSPATRWIWSNGEANDAWLMFRRSVELPADCHAASLRITASFNYLLYVNGTLVTRGPARSYDFCKAYDTVEVQPYLRPGAANVLAVLAPAAGAESPHTVPRLPGILAALSWQDAAGQSFTVATDRRWKVRLHEAFTSGAAGRSFSEGLLLGREEGFDARRELPGWTDAAFDDSDWAPAVELGPVGLAPWTTLEPSGIGLLSDDPVLPVSFAAIELARLPRGYRFRLSSPPRLHTAIKIYVTEITAIAAATVRLNIGHLVHLNGKRIVPDAKTGTFTLP